MHFYSNRIRNQHEKEGLNLIAMLYSFIHLLFFKKERWLDTNYIEKTFVSPQTHLKSIKMKNGLP